MEYCDYVTYFHDEDKRMPISLKIWRSILILIGSNLNSFNFVLVAITVLPSE